jgi:wobble nucleotide-excising tRNase
MIESITIADVASYGNAPQALDGLSQFTFMFGSNAAGKTTISRVIADEDSFPTCKVTWQRGTRLQTMVYNLDFIDKNFHQSAQLKGVFTLGEKHEDILNKIATAKVDLDDLTRKIENLTHKLQGSDGAGGKKGEVAALESVLKEKCWVQKQKHDAALKGAFEGYRGSSEKFKAKVIAEWTSNSAKHVSLSELEKRAKTVFGPTPIRELLIPMVETATLVTYESDPILKKSVVGKNDVDIAALIKKLGNSDWVREGRMFYEVSEGVCPFCQQRTTEAFANSLNEYFDEAFETDSKAIEELSTNYKTEAARIQQQIAEIIAAPPKFLDAAKLKAEKDLFDSRVTINIQLLAGKKKEPSQSVELESLSNVSTAIKTLVDDTNALVAEHNKMVANLSQERSVLTAQVWKYLLEMELKSDLAAYRLSSGDLEKAVAALETNIKEAKKEKERKQGEIRQLERQTTSIQPTIDGINALLISFGFCGFSLAKTEDGTSYKLVRPDGSDAKSTLSEGERSFVTFLYFYHLLKGSDSESGITTDRVVVFDDPVSSLDSDILFIVGSLIKGLFDEVRAGSGYIKQVFVLTHNVYFHREVTFNAKRPRNGAMKKETFWVVRKRGLLSELEKCPSNPIKTSYELLWNEVRRNDRSISTIQNTLRRILENYFKITGGFDLDKLCGMFAGKEKMIYRSLCSWVHAGSHYAHDDLYVSIDDSMVDAYLEVFKAVFDKAGHIAHYKMMMGDASEGEAP